MNKQQNDWLVGQLLKDHESFTEFDRDRMLNLIDALGLDVTPMQDEWDQLMSADLSNT